MVESSRGELTGADAQVNETARDLPPKNGSRGTGSLWAIAVTGGLTAGLASWVVGEFVHDFFRPQLFSVKVVLTTFIQPTSGSLNAADLKNAILVFSVLGAVSGLVMGLTGGFAGRTFKRGLIVGLGGFVGSGLVGGLTSLVLVPIFFRAYVPNPNDLLTPVLIHAGIWTAIGAVSGLAFALGMHRERDIVNSMVGGFFGALIATLSFHGLCEILISDSGPPSMVGNSTLIRLLANLLVTVLVACGAARGTTGHVSKEGSPA